MTDRNMTYRSKIKKIASSNFVLVPIEIVEYLGINPGDEVDITISSIALYSYRCTACGHTFDSDDEHPYCPICENETLEIDTSLTSDKVSLSIKYLEEVKAELQKKENLAYKDKIEMKGGEE